MSKSHRQVPNCLKRAETSVVFNVVLYHTALILLLFLTITLHETGTRKDIFLSVTVYNKYLSSQCSLTAKKNPVQDKNYHNTCIIET